jgi:hypothetical protein
MGARVPDWYAAPTSTVCIEKTFSLVSDAVGNVACQILPHPYVNGVVSIGSTSAGGQFTGWTGSNVYSSSSLISTNSGDVAGRIGNFRIVGWGARFSTIASATNNSGLITLATTSLNSNSIEPYRLPVGGATVNNAAMTMAQYYAENAIPYTGTGDTATVNPVTLTALPKNRNYSAMQLAEKPVTVCPKIVAPQAFDLRNTSDSVYGNEPAPGIATGSIYVGDSSYIRTGGWETILIAGVGLPANTTCIGVEIIYHLEGTPQITSGGVRTDAIQATIDSNLFFRALDVAQKAAPFVIAAIT